ncbi:hypothetical protein V5N11_016099 [Cardamine amara subsp. amara]|uniref:Uncharacterized protein n=1 Tax=Cardamine amara subsp. amara TaxID=228776 RepID=A0ABD1C5Z1_CARAN
MLLLLPYLVVHNLSRCGSRLYQENKFYVLVSVLRTSRVIVCYCGMILDVCGNVPAWVIMGDFQELVTGCGFSDLEYNGPKFTWWNHRELDPIGKILDRAIVNASWRTDFPQAYAEFEANGILDHARCCVHTSVPF